MSQSLVEPRLEAPLPARHFREPSPTEAIYLRTGTQVVSHSGVIGTIGPSEFDRALAALEAHYPILRAAVAAGHFVERLADEPTGVTWIDRASQSPSDLYDVLINRPLDLSASVYAAYVLADAAGFDILLVTSHAVTDATSLVAIHSSLIHFCDCVRRGEVPPVQEQPFPETIDAAVEHCLAALNLTAVPKTVAQVVDADFLRMPQPVTAPAMSRYRMEFLTIEPALTQAMLVAAHGHGVSLHCLLAAAFGLAIRDLSGSPARQMLMRASIDMRRRLEPHISVDLVFSAITGHVTRIVDMDQTIFDIARSIQEDIRAGTQDGRIFQDYHDYPRNFGTPQTAPVALNISDMGAVAFHDEIAALKPIGFDYATGLPQRYPNCSITIFDGRLTANTVYREQDVDPAAMRDLSAGVVAVLNGACLAARTPE